MGRRAVLLLVLLAAAMASSRAALSRTEDRGPRRRDALWVPDGRVLRVASLGQRLLLADLYWLRTVQYVGQRVMSGDQRWDGLYPLADLVTDLDPRYGYAYQVAGSNLAGLAHRYDEADRILMKGMRNVPERWSLPFVYATNKFLFEQDYAEAARYARRAAEVGKRPNLALLAANLSALANTDDEYRAALAFLDWSLEQAGAEELRDELAARRVRVETFMVLSRVERAIAGFRARTGRPPHSLFELLGTDLTLLPADPSGGVLVYDAASGEVASSIIGKRAPLRIQR